MESDSFSVLIRQVMENPVILRNLTTHLKKRQLLPLRLVNHFWKSIIDTEIPHRFKYIIKSDNEDWNSLKLVEDLKIVKSLKISSILFWWGFERENGKPSTINNNFTIAFHLRELCVTPQIQTMEIIILNLKTETDILCFETLINSMPNLKKLKIFFEQVSPKLLQKYGGKFLPKVGIKMGETGDKFEDAEEIVAQVFKIFPNLETNFNNLCMDLALFTNLRTDHEFPQLRKIRIAYFDDNLEEIFKVLGTLDQKVLPNLRAFKILISKVVGVRDYRNLEKFLSNFPLLERVKLFYSMDDDDDADGDNPLCLHLPPLPKLKVLTLEIPITKNGKPIHLLNPGKRLAKNFPCLEKLTFRYTYDMMAEDYNYPKCWGIWEPFLPIGVNDNDNFKGADLSPFEAIRHVDFNLPLHWFEQRENLVWAKEILQVYDKLYARVSKKYSKDIEKLRVFCNQEMSE